MGDGEELERAFAGSSVYFIFNFATLIILLPLEILTGYLYVLTKAMLPSSVGQGENWEGPIKKIVSPLVKLLIVANKKLIDDIATGEAPSCDSFYPVTCTDRVSYETCDMGLIGCDEQTGHSVPSPCRRGESTNSKV
jgi:sodium-dependent phosphate cotransporter